MANLKTAVTYYTIITIITSQILMAIVNFSEINLI